MVDKRNTDEITSVSLAGIGSDSSLQMALGEPPKNAVNEAAQNVNPEHKMDDKLYSAFTHNEKKIIIFCAGLCSFFSPISGQIYFPSLDAVASDLHVSSSLVNLTITTYLVSNFIRFRLKFIY